jgi:hypothetical protein
MKSLSHTPETDRLRGIPLASWPQSLVTVSIEAQAKPDGPWLPSQKNKPIKADERNAEGDDISDSIVAGWVAEANDLVSRGKLHSWRIVLTAEPQVHSFHTVAPAPLPLSARALAPGWKPEARVEHIHVAPPKSVEIGDNA